MPKIDRYGAAKKKNKRNAMLAPLLFVLVIIVLVFVIGLFFRVKNITVEGAETYTDAEILEASGIEEGDNLFFINRFTASSNIFSRLPYVDSASIERSFPDTIHITVVESCAVAYIDWQGQYWMFTAGGKLLGSLKAEEAASLVAVSGFEPDSPTVGDALSVPTDQKSRCTLALAVLSALQTNDMLTETSALDVTDPSCAVTTYDTRFSVKLGSAEQLDYKLSVLLAAIAQLEEDESALLDISDPSVVYVSPY